MKIHLTEIGHKSIEAKINLHNIPVVFHKYDEKKDAEFTEYQTFKSANALFDKIKSDKSIFMYRIDTAQAIKFDVLVDKKDTYLGPLCKINEKSTLNIVFDNFGIHSLYYPCFPMGPLYLNGAGSKIATYVNRHEKPYIIVPTEQNDDAMHQGCYTHQNRIIALDDEWHGKPIRTKGDFFSTIGNLTEACADIHKQCVISIFKEQMEKHVFKFGSGVARVGQAGR